jgi:hypothetical protein
MINSMGRKILIAAVSFYLLLILVYILFQFIQPVYIVDNYLHYKYNNPVKVNNAAYKLLRSGIISITIIFVLLLLYRSRYFDSIKSLLKKFAERLLVYLNLNTLLLISLIYTAVLFIISVISYDLGIDEAWYLDWARNFAHSGIAYSLVDGKMFLIDTITMLPFYLLSVINFSFGLTHVWNFKLLAVLFSSGTIYVLFKITRLLFNRSIAVLFLFLLILQPGFGFVASSFFGEFLQSAFLFGGLFYWFKDSETVERKNIIITSLLFSVAIHTKFQLLVIFIIVLILLYMLDKKTKSLAVLGYTMLFTFLIELVRILPVFIANVSYTKDLLVLSYLLFHSVSETLNVVMLDRVQLFNRFYSIGLFVIIMLTFGFYMRKPVEKFLFLFSLVSIFWWIFFYPYVTYRHPFIGIITVCLMAGILIFRLYEYYVESRQIRTLRLKFASAFAVFFLIIYGFSANLIYAYIGYNDGVQFDMDGFKNRLFEKIEHDNSQKDFYYELGKITSPGDTLYNGSFVAKFYMPGNPVCSFDKLKEDIRKSPGERYVLVTRGLYPGSFDKIHSKLDSLGGNKKLLIKIKGHELYQISK